MEKIMNELDELFRKLELTYQEDNNAPDSFNVFDAFRIQRSELAWSAWIAYLLNPQENHGCGDIFLKLFIKLLSVPIEINTKCAKVNPEFVMELGRIDILVHDPDGENAIIIENKIDAGDQEKQLYRYYKYAKEKFNDFRIFYLTRLKSKPSKDSIKGEDKDIGENGELQEGKHFFCISYIDDIKNWLLECKEECDESNPVRTIIEQSINEIDVICHQTVVDEEFQKEVERILNANGKTSIADKVEVLKKNEVEKFPKSSEKLFSLIKIYQRDRFSELIHEHFPSVADDDISKEGKLDGYWCCRADNINDEIKGIYVMHDWADSALYGGIEFKETTGKIYKKLVNEKLLDEDKNNHNTLICHFGLDDFDELYKHMKKILDVVCKIS